MQHNPYTDALSPAEEMKNFDLDTAFSIALFASEPYVQSPVDISWDDEGNVYVVEMGDYPWKSEPDKGKGRIRVLWDIDGDGLIDSATTFANKIADATSILPWQGGLIVTAAPYILYLKDTTGDFQADTREVLFEGFYANNSEAQITCLRFGVDNWIYANNNAQEGEVTFVRNKSAPKLAMVGSDFRFRLDKGLFEKESGWGQFGSTIDDWGHRFYTQNTFHIQYSPIDWRYLHRHEFMPPGSSDINISDHELIMYQQTPPPHWRSERTKRRQENFDKLQLDRKEYADKHFTGASGGTFYLSDVFPKEYYGSVFTGDVSGNLVHRDVLLVDKEIPVFTATRGEREKEREFLASADPWTRPVNFSVGPDGLIYMVDMYRQHIESPASVPEDLKEHMDYSNGQNHGRIYQIFPKGWPLAKRVTLNLKNRSSAELVTLLTNENQWTRERAHMMLVQRQDRSVIAQLKKMFLTHNDGRTRLRSLYVLESLDAIDATLVSKALKDSEPGIREQAAILSEKYPQLLAQLLELVYDSSSQVVLQATLSLGNAPDARVIQAFKKVIEDHGEQPLFRTAVLSSEIGSSAGMLRELVSGESFLNDTTKAKFISDLCYVMGARNDEKEIAEIKSIVKNDSSLQSGCQQGMEEGRMKHR